MNVIDELTELLGEAPALSQPVRDRAKEKLMSDAMSFESAESHTRRRRLRRRIAVTGVVAVAAASALVVGIGGPGGNSPLKPAPASAAALALRAAADTQRGLPETPPDLTDVDPAYVKLIPVLQSLPLDGDPAETWTWIDAHCREAAPVDRGETLGTTTPQQAADEQNFADSRDCGLMASFGFLAVATPAQTATLLDAIAALPAIHTAEGQCQSGGGAVLHGPSQEFRVSRNGTDAVLTLTHGPSGIGRLWISMTLWIKSVPPPCPQIVPSH
jgi:hypothetical protein